MAQIRLHVFGRRDCFTELATTGSGYHCEERGGEEVPKAQTSPNSYRPVRSDDRIESSLALSTQKMQRISM